MAARCTCRASWGCSRGKRTKHPFRTSISLVSSRSLAHSNRACHSGQSMARSPGNATLIIGPQGRVVIPADLRRHLGFEPGEAVVARVEDGRLVLERREHILRRLRDEVRGSMPEGASAVDALVAERREEARREAEGEHG